MNADDSQLHSPSLEQTRLHIPHLPHGLPPSPVSTHHSESRLRPSFEVDPGGREERLLPFITITGHKSPGHFIFNAQPDSGNGKSEATVLRELVEARNTAIDLRIFTGRNRQTYIDQRRFTMEYFAEFVKAAGSLLSQISVDPSILKDWNSLQKLHERLVESTNHLESREISLRKDESKLNRLDDKLLQIENTYYGQAAPISLVDDPVPHSPKSFSEDEPELVRQYYERLRDANSFRDDLVNFSAEYQRAMNKRTTRRMRGETVKLSEFEFVKKYSQKRKTRLQKFESARKDVLRLRQECIENGLSVDDPDIPPFDEELCPDPLTGIPETFIRYVSSFGHSDDLLVKDPNTVGRVATWVNDVIQERKKDGKAVIRKHYSDSEIYIKP